MAARLDMPQNRSAQSGICFLGNADQVLDFEDLEDYQEDDDAPYPEGSYHDEGGMQSYDGEEMEMDDFIVDEAADRRRGRQKRRGRDVGMSAAYQEALKVCCMNGRIWDRSLCCGVGSG